MVGGSLPLTVPRDWRWADAPRPDPDTGTTPFAPTAAADDVPALRAEARAWCADPAASLRSAIVADLEHALGRALAERDEARRKHDRLASRIRGARAVLDGAAVAAAPPEPDAGPCGWATR